MKRRQIKQQRENSVLKGSKPSLLGRSLDNFWLSCVRGMRFLRRIIGSLLTVGILLRDRPSKTSKDSEKDLRPQQGPPAASFAELLSQRVWPSRGLRLDLRQFAAEEEGRTEDPTERRFREAREKGQVAKTQELSQALTMLVGFFTFYLIATWVLFKMLNLTKRFFADFWQYTFEDPQVMQGFWFIIVVMAKILAPILVVTFVVAIVANVAQVGFLFTLKPLAMDITKIKLDPGSMVKKILFSRQVAMNLGKSLFKVTVVGYLSYAIIASDFEVLMKTSQLSPTESLVTISYTVFKLVIWVSLLLLLLAIPDFFFQKSELKEQLKMTKQEVKQEHKEQEGDPMMRSQLRERREEMLRNRMIQEVPEADVVITNPSHYAVALKMSEYTRTPEVLAKGEDYLARKIKEIAKENSIYIIENKPLAQALYNQVEIGQAIPPELYQVVVEIYAMLIQRNPSRFSYLQTAG